MQTYRHLIKPHIPALDPERLENIQRTRPGLHLAQVIESMNLEGCLPPYDAFLASVPDVSQIRRRIPREIRDLEAHLEVESCFWTIARIRLDSNAPGRKSEAFISTNPTVLRTLTLTAGRLVEAEYWRRFSKPMRAMQIYDIFKDCMQSLDRTPLGSMLRVLGGVLEVTERNAASPWVGTDRYNEVVERNLWRRSALKWQMDDPILVEAGARPTRPVDREAQNASPRKASWEKSFDFLGPFLACRMLARRQELQKLEKWVQGNLEHPELPRIYKDLSLDRQRLLGEENVSLGHIDHLTRILNRIQAAGRAGASQTAFQQGMSANS